MKKIPCAAKCGAQLSRVNEHAVGWRPICEQCKALTWWFDEARFEFGGIAVRKPNENFGQNPEGPGILVGKLNG